MINTKAIQNGFCFGVFYFDQNAIHIPVWKTNEAVMANGRTHYYTPANPGHIILSQKI